jgi:hypothetical protein
MENKVILFKNIEILYFCMLCIDAFQNKSGVITFLNQELLKY